MWILSSFETEDRFSFYFWVHHHCVFSVFFRLVSGFGITQDRGRPAKQLKYVHLPVVDQETCESFTLFKDNPWQTTCFVLDSLKEGRTPVLGMVEAPMPWRTMDGFGLQGLSAGGLAVDGRDHMESTPESLTTWTGSRRPCRRTES